MYILDRKRCYYVVDSCKYGDYIKHAVFLMQTCNLKISTIPSAKILVCLLF